MPRLLPRKRGGRIRQPHIIRPALGADLDMMRAFKIAAIDEQVAKTRRSHVSERDLLWAALFVIAAAGEDRHALLKRGRDARTIPL